MEGRTQGWKEKTRRDIKREGGNNKEKEENRKDKNKKEIKDRTQGCKKVKKWDKREGGWEPTTQKRK